MRELARAGRQRGRSSGHRAAIPDWFRQYADLEAATSEMNDSSGSQPDTEDVDRQVAVRLADWNLASVGNGGA